MAKRTVARDPLLNISFWRSGFYTNRDPLFQPITPVGVTVIQWKDSLIDGLNMELLDTFQIQRRPGYSKFCSVQLGSSEIVNQFYSSRNLNTQVTTSFDSNTRWASFTPSNITTIVTKTTGAGQGFPLTIGNMTYFSDGVGADIQKWDGTITSSWGLAAPTTTPSIVNVGCWLPKTNYGANIPVVDSNGNVEVSFISVAGVTSQTQAYTAFGAIGIIGAYNYPNGWTLDPHPVTGQHYWQATTPSGDYSNYAGFTGFGFSIPAGATILGVIVNITKECIADIAMVATDYSVKLLVAGAPTGTEHASGADWPAVLHTSGIGTGWGTSSYGASADKWGIALTPAIVNAAGFGVAIAGTSSTGGYIEINTVPYPPTIQIFYSVPTGPTGSGTSGLYEPVWSTTINSPTQDGSITWTNVGPILIWYPATNYPTPAVTLDTNGNLEITTTSTNPIAAWSSITAYSVGQAVTFAGAFWTAVSPSTGVAPTAAYTVTTTSGSTATSQPRWIETPTPVTTGYTAPTWNTTVGGTTTDGSYTWTNLGPGTLVESFGTSYVFGYRTIYGHLTTSSPFSINTGPILGPQSGGITSFSITSNVVTFKGTNNFQPGDTFTMAGMEVGTYLNGVTFVVLAAGLSTTQFSANFAYPNVSSTPDFGVTQNLIATVSSQGTDSPLCNATATITSVSVLADIVTLVAANDFVPGLFVTFSGMNPATFLNGIQAQVISATAPGQPEGTAPTQFQVYLPGAMNYPATAQVGGTATFNAIEIYRTSDGGGLYLFAGAVTNPGASATWTYSDFTTDANLNILLQAPLDNLNDPPPGAPGSTITTPGTVTCYWQGRIWMADGNFVYYDAGPDCINGIPEESWPPGNYFRYPAPVWALCPVSGGLLVFMDDRVDIILGGPETISFWTKDFLKNFGVSSYNSVFQDGDVIYVYTTQGQCFVLEPDGKAEEGQYIANYLSTNFSSPSTYVTFHRDGEDIGLFLSNGSNTILRYGANVVRAWSVPAKPVGGCGAVNSIEITAGTYGLMMAPATGGGYLQIRDLSSFSDGGTLGLNNGTAYGDGKCYATVGSITLAELGAGAVALQHIVGYFSAVGEQPSIAILPNEISETNSVGFIDLPETLQEPPIGQTVASTSIWALRYPINMFNSAMASQWIHHLQVKISFENDTKPNTIRAISFMEDQQT